MSAQTSVLVNVDATKFISECGYMYLDESRISQTLICTICSEPWVEPVEASGCGHVFCERCIRTWVRHIPSCPIDRSSLPPKELSPASRILKELVNELVVICSLGCGWSGRRDDWKAHLETTCPEAKSQGSKLSQAVLAATASVSQIQLADKEESFKERWKKLAREVQVLKKEAKDYVATIGLWKDKVSKLQLELRQANESAIVTPVRSSTASGRQESHCATCDLCNHSIYGVRFKCLKCPDFDACSGCYAKINERHPVHDFVPIHKPGDVEVVSLPEWKIRHPGITCNKCYQNVVGPRFKCTICVNYDLCQHCMALPQPPHPIGHPMTRFVNPVIRLPRRGS